MWQELSEINHNKVGEEDDKSGVWSDGNRSNTGNTDPQVITDNINWYVIIIID